MCISCTSDAPRVRVVASPDSWIEGDAVRQLEAVAALPGMIRVAGMPDLHPGKGGPVGAAFLSEGVVYPHLVGNDIGCGMGMWRTAIESRRAKPEKLAKALSGLDGPWDGDHAAALAAEGVPLDLDSPALGTVGGGNHFAELQAFEQVADSAALTALGLDPSRLVLLVHSGSRGLGEAILRAHADRYGASGLADGSAEAAGYMRRHDQAVAWGRANRAAIASRFLAALGAVDHGRALDLCHNAVMPVAGAPSRWLHRKGAAPADSGHVVVPGSRGARTYLLRPCGRGDWALASLAHGAGRKWTRSDAKARLSKRFRAEDMVKTALGGRVVCGDRDLLFEEAPQAYKDVDRVVADLVEAGLAEIVAVLRPVVTFKTAGKAAGGARGREPSRRGAQRGGRA